MKDFVSKGLGNSRFLKSVSNFLSLYPTYADFAAALIAGTLPVDFNGVNSAGVTQVGTALNKANLLTDATAAALELSGDPTVNDALYALSQKTQPALVNITTVANTACTLTKGSVSVSGTANASGKLTLQVAELGNWTLTCTLSGASWTQNVYVQYIGLIDVDAVPTLEASSWALIDALSAAGKANTVYAVGDKKTVNIGGTNYQVQIIGFNHDTKTAGGKAGITFQLVDCLNTTYKMENSNINTNGWRNCQMRKTHLPAIKNTLPSDLRSVIKMVNKLASAGNQSATIYTDSDDLFLLSEVEIFGTTTYSKSGEGTQYAWYAAGNSKVKKVNGSANNWWERSPYGSNTTSFCSVNSNGNASAYNASSSSGVSFGFCV